jgi:alkanesulfonate monooxygenase SsuD/methylene tetrahydromethanopterin reductase-like flavin-dependent oxidoreductase (luciferase family)
MLAKSIVTIDHFSDGRVEAAVGGGFYPGEHAALGSSSSTPPVASSGSVWT